MFFENDYDDDLDEYLEAAKSIALRLSSGLPDRFEAEDLIQVASVSVLEAIEAFDPTLGMAKMSYVRTKVKGKLIDHVRSHGTQRRDHSRISREIAEQESKFLDEFGRMPSNSELVSRLGISQKKLTKYYEDANLAKFVSFDEEISTQTPSDDLENEVMLEKIVENISKLDEGEQLILSLYFNEGCTLREIKEILGISEARIHQIKDAAIEKLRRCIN